MVPDMTRAAALITWQPGSGGQREGTAGSVWTADLRRVG